MKIRVRANEDTEFMREMDWVLLGIEYDVVGINEDSYEINHLAIIDETGDRLVLFDDEYEVVGE